MPRIDTDSRAKSATRSPEKPALLPWALLLFWTLLLFSGLFFAPRIWAAVISLSPVGALQTSGAALLAGFLVLSVVLVRGATVPAGRLLGLVALWGVCFGACIAALSRYPAELLHAAEYAVLALLARRAFRSALPGKAAWAGSVVFAAGTGILEEVLQIWIPGRFFDYRDVALNACAVLFGLLLAACMEYARSGTDDPKRSPLHGAHRR